MIKGKSLEILTAVLLSIATVGSTWCAYQAKLWGSAQTFALADMNTSGRQAALARTEAAQQRNLDVFLFLEYLKALRMHDVKAMEFFQKRLRPELEEAIEAWLRTRPLQNPDAPRNPFEMPQYRSNRNEQAAQRWDARSEEKRGKAEKASGNSDNYIMMTVIFAAVLFFAGISTQLGAPHIRVMLLALAGIVLLFAGWSLSSFPIAGGS